MFGAIIGDIIGSRFEFHNIKTKDFDLFTKDCFFTDDTVMTIAVADAIMSSFDHPLGQDEMDDKEFDTFQKVLPVCLKKWGRQYPGRGYGGRFQKWLDNNQLKGYGSYGNGSAMRVSPCAWAVKIGGFHHEYTDQLYTLASMSAKPTHNHPEGIRGAEEVARAIWYMRWSRNRDEVVANKKMMVAHSSYDLNISLHEIRKNYHFDETCQGSVPQAIRAFLESYSFEDAVRNAVSIGGDSDTIAAIAGSIAEAAYHIPEEIKVNAWKYLDKPIKDVLLKWNRWVKN